MRPLMFGILMLLSLLHFYFGQLPDYNEIERSLNVTHRTLQRENIELVRFIKADTFFNTYEQTIKQIDSIQIATRDLDKYLQNSQQTIAKARSKQDESINGLQAIRNEQVRKTLSDQHLADSIQYHINLYYSYIKSFVRGYNNWYYYEQQLPLLRFHQTSGLPHVIHKIALFASSEDLLILLSALRNDILMSEALIIQCVYSNNSYSYGGYESLNTMVTSSRRYYLDGERVSYKIMLAAYSRRLNPIIKASSGTIVKQEAGIATWEIQDYMPGLKTVTGTATKYDRDGYKHEQPWSFQYIIAAKGAAIQIDNTNTCYAGIPNLVTISVPGYTDDNINLKVDGALVSKIKNGQFEIIPEKNKTELYAYVNAKNSEGHESTVARRKLIVKQVPAPIAIIKGSFDGKIRKDEIKDISIVPTNEDVPLSYNVVSYTVLLIRNKIIAESVSAEASSSDRHKHMEDIAATAQNGDKLIIDDIVVQGSNELIYNPASVSYIVN